MDHPCPTYEGINEVWKESLLAVAKITVLVCSSVKGISQEKEM